MIRAVIFDCFGVIISDALEVIVSELAVTNLAGAEEIRGLVRASNLGIIDARESSQGAADILGVSLEEYQQRIREGELKDRRVLGMIKELRRSYKTALLSNISAPGLLKRFTEAEMAEYFDVVVTSGEIRCVKPDPEAYEITAQRLGVRVEECVFIDDRRDFVIGAEEVGMQAIWFQNFEQVKADLEKILAK